MYLPEKHSNEIMNLKIDIERIIIYEAEYNDVKSIIYNEILLNLLIDT